MFEQRINAHPLGAPEEQLEEMEDEEVAARPFPPHGMTFMQMLMESWDGFDMASPLVQNIDVMGGATVARRPSTGLGTSGEAVDARALARTMFGAG
jgi:hypothetical protein